MDKCLGVSATSDNTSVFGTETGTIAAVNALNNPDTLTIVKFQSWGVVGDTRQ
jgi:hypothetical protein